MTKSVQFDDLLLAFEFVSGAPQYEHQAFLCFETGVIHYQSDLSDLGEELPDDIDNVEKYIVIPHKSDLDLGSRLAMRFADDFLPDAADDVRDIFRRKGAYGRFKKLLDSRGALQPWYDYEQQCTNEALRRWCESNEIEIRG